MLAEKKNTMAIQVFRHRELAQKIAGLTEDIAELKSKKALLLNQLNCTDDHGIDEIKQHIASMGASLETLNQQEEKYSAERDVALAQYAELQQRVVDVDTIELEDALIKSGKQFNACKPSMARSLILGRWHRVGKMLLKC